MPNDLYRKMAQLQWLMHRQHLRRVAAGGPLADTSRGQGRILSLLKMQDGISTKELAYLLGIRVSSLNELLAKLERNGYVTREQSESDGRVSLVKLTEKGKSEQPAAASDPNDIFSSLSSAEQSQLNDYLDRLISTLDTDDEPTFGEFPGFPMPVPPMFGVMPPPHAQQAPPQHMLAENCPCKITDCPHYRNCRPCRESHHFSGTQTACGR